MKKENDSLYDRWGRFFVGLTVFGIIYMISYGIVSFILYVIETGRYILIPLFLIAVGILGTLITLLIYRRNQ